STAASAPPARAGDGARANAAHRPPFPTAVQPTEAADRRRGPRKMPATGRASNPLRRGDGARTRAGRAARPASVAPACAPRPAGARAWRGGRGGPGPREALDWGRRLAASAVPPAVTTGSGPRCREEALSMASQFLSSEEYDERAHDLFNDGDYDAALNTLKEGLRLYPHSVELYVGMGYTRLAREE